MIQDTYHHNGSNKWTARVTVRAKHELKAELQNPRPALWAGVEASLIASILVTILLLDKPKRG